MTSSKIKSTKSEFFLTKSENQVKTLYLPKRKAHGLNCLTYWLKHQEAVAALRRLIERRRRETWRQFCDQMARGNYSKTTARFSRIRKGRTIKPTFSSLDPNKSSADTMASHLENIYSAHLVTDVSRMNSFLAPTMPPYHPNTYPFDLDDIVENLKHLPKKKAPGVDHVQVEMIVPIADLIAPTILLLFQLCYSWSYTPISWRVAQVIPIHKKGLASDPNNFRPISLTSTFRKLFEKCIYCHLTSTGSSLDIAQGGFRECRSSLDQASLPH